ncbi:MAG: hypothetical protein Q8N26_35920 [Myxococcales bacterium]|nr:hypothetical protein [Myxococcales bacterium]
MRLLFLTTALLGVGASAGTLERTFVPQLDDTWETFRSLEPETTALPATTVVLCEVSVPRLRYDSFAGADLRVSLSVNGVSAGLVNGPNDADWALAGFPVTLARGDRLSLTVWDRDLTELELVGSGSVMLGATLPVTFTKSAFTATCRGVPEAMTLRRQEMTIAHVDASLAALTPLPAVRLSAANLGRPDRELRVLENALNAAGTWQGWTRPVLAERLRSAAALEAQWTRAVAAEIATQLERLPPAGQPVMLQAGVTEVTVGALRCVRGKCGLSLELHNLSAEALDRANSEVPEEAFDRAELISAGGDVVDFSFPAPRSAPDGGVLTAIAPGGRATVKVTGWLNTENGAPRLLRLHTPFGWKVLRLREP